MSDSDIQYYRASHAHIQELIDFRITFMQSLGGTQAPEVVDELSQSLAGFFHRALSNDTYICWLAADGDRIIGLGGMSIREHPGNFKNPSGKVGYLMNMYTAPSYRRRGICSALVQRLIETGTGMGIRAFELHATNEGEPVYQKQGFILHGEPTYRRFVA